MTYEKGWVLRFRTRFPMTSINGIPEKQLMKSGLYSDLSSYSELKNLMKDGQGSGSLGEKDILLRPDDLSSRLMSQGRRKELTPKIGSLTSTHVLWLRVPL